MARHRIVRVGFRASALLGLDEEPDIWAVRIVERTDDAWMPMGHGVIEVWGLGDPRAVWARLREAEKRDGVRLTLVYRKASPWVVRWAHVRVWWSDWVLWLRGDRQINVG